MQLLTRITGVAGEPGDEFAATGHIRRMVSRIGMAEKVMRVTLTTGAVLETVHLGKIVSQLKTRSAPPWLHEAQELLAGGHSKASAARRLGVVPCRLYRAIDRYAGAPG
ncbi:hypothetical protein KXR53_33675 [Inquilinus limosus]|uniref:hypothetical protein n=1 Tax=Inquilinus limosus TaxID=171674 RepID=UPI003F16565F